jgi:hypothetical protein
VTQKQASKQFYQVAVNKQTILSSDSKASKQAILLTDSSDSKQASNLKHTHLKINQTPTLHHLQFLCLTHPLNKTRDTKIAACKSKRKVKKPSQINCKN